MLVDPPQRGERRRQDVPPRGIDESVDIHRRAVSSKPLCHRAWTLDEEHAYVVVASHPVDQCMSQGDGLDERQRGHRAIVPGSGFTGAGSRLVELDQSVPGQGAQRMLGHLDRGVANRRLTEDAHQ